MEKNAIQNIFLKNSNSYSYILPVMNAICQHTGLKVVVSDKIEYKTENLFIAVNNRDEVEKQARYALEKQIANTIIANGADNFPFITPFGESFVAEAWKNKIFSYSLNPKILGIKETSVEKIKCDNIEHSKKIVSEILSGKLKDEKFDVVKLNCALCLYISKKANSIIDAFDLFEKIIQTYDLN